jgi:hypothetical protein
MRLMAFPPIPFSIWVVGPAETYALLPIFGPRRRGPGRIDGIRGHGTLLFGVRGSPTGFPRDELPESRFDGIFANASLFHVSQELPRVLAELSATLRSRGVLFCSNPRGNNEEGFSGDRYSCFLNHDTWRDYVTAAGFLQVGHYYRPPGLTRHKQWWLATVWRKG